MTMTDPLADMLTRIRNAQAVKLVSIKFAYSNIKFNVLKVLKQEGYIQDFETVKEENLNYITVNLKYSREGKPAITEIKRESKPGRRVYSSIQDLKPFYNEMGCVILSTSNGVLSNADAKKQNVGGEVLCKVF